MESILRLGLIDRSPSKSKTKPAGHSGNRLYSGGWTAHEHELQASLYLVDTLNGYFSEPLVVSSKGGRSGGGAALTDTGRAVLECYRRAQAKTEQAVNEELAELSRVHDLHENEAWPRLYLNVAARLYSISRRPHSPSKKIGHRITDLVIQQR